MSSRRQPDRSPWPGESEIQFLLPTEVRWKLGDRQVVCLVAPSS
jgi:hypothetical protein